MKKLISILVALFATTALYAETPTVAPVVHPENDAVYIAEGIRILPKTTQEENQAQYYKIDTTYPQINGQNLSDNAQKFNKVIRDFVNNDIKQFKKYVAADSIHMKTLPEDVKHNSLQIDYDVDVVKPTNQIIISVRLSIEGYQAGRPHPYHQHHVVNFDLASGKDLTLSELFQSKANFLKVISQYSNKKLTEKLQDKWLIAEGTKPLAKNFKNWNLESDGILITFDQYQVAPYVDGAQEVEIPYADLGTVISPNAPIFPCVKDAQSCAVVKKKNTAVD